MRRDSLTLYKTDLRADFTVSGFKLGYQGLSASVLNEPRWIGTGIEDLARGRKGKRGVNVRRTRWWREDGGWSPGVVRVLRK